MTSKAYWQQLSRLWSLSNPRSTEMFLHIPDTHSMHKGIYSNIVVFVFLWSIIQTFPSQEPLLHHWEISHKIPPQPIQMSFYNYDRYIICIIHRKRKNGEGLSTPYFCVDEKSQILTKGTGKKGKGIVTPWKYSEIILKGSLHHSETKKFW